MSISRPDIEALRRRHLDAVAAAMAYRIDHTGRTDEECLRLVELTTDAMHAGMELIAALLGET